MLNLIFPIVGVILSNLFGFNICKTYIENRLVQQKEYNEPLFNIIFYNSISWGFYGIIFNDIFVYLSVLSTLLFSYLFIQNLYKNLKIEKLFLFELTNCIFITYFLFLVFLFNFSQYSFIVKIIIGYTSIITTIITNISPLLIIREVIKTKNNSLIYLPQALIGLINLSCWVTYGFLINDLYQIIANSICIFFCLLQIIAYYSYIGTN